MIKATKDAQLTAELIHSFLTEPNSHLKSQNENTNKGYSDSLTLYIKYLETVKRITPEKLNMDCFGKTIIEEWLLWLSEHRNCSVSTCNKRLGAIRCFLKFVGEKKLSFLYLYENATNIKRGKTPKKKINGVSRNALEAIFNSIDVSTKSGQRDLTLILTMYCTATRIDELLSLKIRELKLDGKKPMITVIGKGSKIRTVLLLPKAVSHLKRYMAENHGNPPDENAYVFYSRNTGPSGKLSQAAVSKRLRNIAETARRSCKDVPLNLHAHQLRHARSSHWLEEGVNILQISYLLGHESVDTTMVYLDITTEQELAAMATLEDEYDKAINKKWKSDNGSLSSFSARYVPLVCFGHNRGAQR